MQTVYIEVYQGIRGKWRMGIHTSIYVDGDPYEWTYGGRSNRESTHNTVYRGIIYEKRKQFSHENWKFWKSVPVGIGKSLCDKNDKESLRCARRRIQKMLPETYDDRGYHWLNNNCWKFCYDLMVAMNISIPRDTIENLNDERIGTYTGTTYISFHYIAKPIAFVIGMIIEVLVLMRIF